jgi:hypothetical protein
MGEEECFAYVFKNTKTNNVKVGITRYENRYNYKRE